MKKIILIDCMPNGLSATRRTGYTGALSVFKGQIIFEIISFKQLFDYKIYQQIASSAGLLISGSLSNITDPGIPEQMAPLIQLIKDYTHPILGICFGHQLIGYTYGCEVGYMPESIRETEWDVCIDLSISVPCSLITHNPIRVEVMHHQEIRPSAKVLENFQILSSSPNCPIEMIQHQHRPIYGVQFHPETIKEPLAQEHGRELIQTFIKFALK